MTKSELTAPKIKLGVSACLLGNPVRFDGGHKHQAYLTETLVHYFDFVPVCPELAIGLGVPRQSLRLFGDAGSLRAIGSRDSSVDVTDALVGYGQQVAQQLDDICGFVVKKDSPSCGMARVRVYDASGVPSRDGVGVFTQALMRAQPCLPVEEEGRLNDPILRENFFERVFIYRRWKMLLDQGLTPAGLIQFHARHKYIFMSRGQQFYRQLGQLVAQAGCVSVAELGERYFLAMMQILKRKTNRKRHSNVLYHLLGYFKRQLVSEDKQELVQTIEAYRLGRVPLVVPLTLLKSHLKWSADRYLACQYYFEPYPAKLGLRNAI